MSWSESIFGREGADVEEVASLAMRAAARVGGIGGGLIGVFEIGRGNGLSRWEGWAIELQEQAGLSGTGTFGRVPEAEVSHLVEALGQNVLKEAAHELVTAQAAGAPAR